jgi:predicted transcriptional regulator
MKRTTISLPDELATRVEREARRRRVSVSQVAREALEYQLGGSRRRKFSFIGIGSSGEKATGRDAEEILAAEWEEFLASERLFVRDS